MQIPRQQLVVAPRIQGDLMARMALVSIFTLLVSGVVYGVRNTFFPGGEGWAYAAAPLVATFVIALPLVIYYAVRVTNRLVAPVIRLWHLTRLMSEDLSHVKPIEFREGDPWNELAHDFNTMLATIREELEYDRPDDSRQAVAVREESTA